MKKLLLMILGSVFILTGLVFAVPVEVSNLAELQAINEDLSGDYVLVNDIDASPTDPNSPNFDDETYTESGFLPLGDDTSNYFSGTFDGNGYVISGLYIDRKASNHVGLFGVLRGGTISNVGVEDAEVYGAQRCGILVGYRYLSGLVENCYVTGYLEALAGESGGLVGRVHNGTGVQNSYSLAEVYNATAGSTGRRVGGFVGYITGTGVVDKCFSAGLVHGVSGIWDTGGFAGAVHNDGTATDSFWDTETSGYESSAAGTGKTTAEMKDIDTFTEWDIVENADYVDEDWKINDNDGVTYPMLGWEDYASGLRKDSFFIFLQ